MYLNIFKMNISEHTGYLFPVVNGYLKNKWSVFAGGDVADEFIIFDKRVPGSRVNKLLPENRNLLLVVKTDADIIYGVVASDLHFDPDRTRQFVKTIVLWRCDFDFRRQIRVVFRAAGQQHSQEKHNRYKNNYPQNQFLLP